MKTDEYTKLLELDCKYYDTQKQEIKNIVKLIRPKGKTILDVGAGIGRLAFPLTKYAKEVVALDQDKRLKKYYEEHKVKNLTFIRASLKQYSRKGEKFDVILIAWTIFDFEFVKDVKRLVHKNSLIVTITGGKKSDFNKLISDIVPECISNEKKIPNSLKLIKKVKLKTDLTFPNEKIALKTTEIDLKLWFNKKLNNNERESILKGIRKYKKKNKIKLYDIVYIKLLKLK